MGYCSGVKSTTKHLDGNGASVDPNTTSTRTLAIVQHWLDGATKRDKRTRVVVWIQALLGGSSICFEYEIDGRARVVSWDALQVEHFAHGL